MKIKGGAPPRPFSLDWVRHLPKMQQRAIVQAARELTGYNPNITLHTMQMRELFLLSPFAWPSAKSLGRLEPILDDHRNPYSRDADRILHAVHFKRLDDKTQVFGPRRHPDIHDRLFHTLKVAEESEDISYYLGLNQRLARAIALGHDVGHSPFGHDGEKALNRISQKYLGKPFKHNLHSLRVVDFLEVPHPFSEEKEDKRGLNLSHEVRNGIVNHNGETVDRVLMPGKVPDDLANLSDGEMPYTLEACVVRVTDQIAYLAHDTRDAYILKLIRPQDLPPLVKEVLGTDPDAMIGVMVRDVIDTSRGKNYITMSDRVFEARDELFHFSYSKIIGSEIVQKARKIIPAAMETLYRYYTEKYYHAENRQMTPQEAIDEIAGLTDTQAKERFNAVRKLHGIMRVPE